MKMCNWCKLQKVDFGKDSRNKDGFQNTCNTCINIRRSELYLLNPEKYKQRVKKYNNEALIRAKKHISEISDKRVRNVEDELTLGQRIKVQYVGSANDKMKFSRKAIFSQ